MAFWKLIAVSKIWREGFIRYIASSLLNMISLGGMIVQNRNGGKEYGVHA